MTPHNSFIQPTAENPDAVNHCRASRQHQRFIDIKRIRETAAAQHDLMGLADDEVTSISNRNMTMPPG